MTSTFDSLGSLYYIAYEKGKTEIRPLIRAVFEEAWRQIKEVNPELHSWENFKERFYTNEEVKDEEYAQKIDYVLDAHDRLDHTSKYHLKTMDRSLAHLICKLSDDLHNWSSGEKTILSSHLRLSFMRPKDFRRYRVIWEEIINLDEAGILNISHQDRFKKLKSGFYWVEHKRVPRPKDAPVRVRKFKERPPLSFDPTKRGFVRQCIRCLEYWPKGYLLNKNGSEKGTCPYCGGRQVIDTSWRSTQVVVRDDLLMLTGNQYPAKFAPRTGIEEMDAAKRGPGLVAKLGNITLFISRGFENPALGHYAYLKSDRKVWMITDAGERESMTWAIVDKCPENARVFVAGLGLGLVLLYLAKSRKSTEVVVAENNGEIINLIEPIIRPWLEARFPSFKFTVIHGDALVEVKRNGVFDWVFFDIWSNMSPSTNDRNGEPSIEATREASKEALSSRGVYTSWIDVVEEYKIR